MPKNAAVTIILMSIALFAGAASAAEHRIYAHLLEPREHPDDDRRAVRPPSWETFGNQTQFATLRGFGVENGLITGYAEELGKYTETYDLGRVIWPSYPIVFAKNLDVLADEIKRRNLFLFDIWGYVPGSGPGGYWQQYHPAREALDMLEAKLGDHWLGMDIGEQDGRYIGGYAGQVFPISEDRFAQYLNFQRHFERMGNELGNKLSTLVSLNFGHYFLKEGVYATIGAETAQALPNSQVYYAFIRGAGKQYGVPWFGNASVFNRWGYKNYDGTGPDHSATKGTSLNLLKRLMYSHILYNSVFVGFESGWFQGDQLSPIGHIQQSAQQWIRVQGQPGVMVTPVALLFDFFSGWSFPRHLYTDRVYRVWGNIPFGPGDYFGDGVLDLLYPGYQDSSYFHDESGFMTPTPYGDIADCLLSDAPAWLLERYPLIIAVSGLSGGAELRGKLEEYVRAGGHLTITAGNLAKWPGGLCGVKALGTPQPAAEEIDFPEENARVSEAASPLLYALEFPAEAHILARAGDQPAALEVPFGKGRITALASPFGVPGQPAGPIPAASQAEAPLPKPYPLLAHVKVVLENVLRQQVLFDAGKEVSLIVCRKAPGAYTLGVCSNSLHPAPFEIASHVGAITSIAELPLDTSEKTAVGYLPEGFENAAIGSSGAGVIAGGDVRIFAVSVQEEDVSEIAHTAPKPRPRGRVLPLTGHRAIREEILARPTFFEHFDAICVNWRYLYDRERRALEEEAAWTQRQGIRVYVDLTSGINLYPDIRLINNDAPEYAASMAIIDDVLVKMASTGAHDLILSPHRQPENNFTWEQTETSFIETLREICRRAGERSITVYLRVSNKLRSGIEDNARFVTQAGMPNLRLAPSWALLRQQKRAPESIPENVWGLIGLWLASAPAYETEGSCWSLNAPLATLPDDKSAAAWLARKPECPVLLDVPYTDADQEYSDIRMLESR